MDLDFDQSQATDHLDLKTWKIQLYTHVFHFFSPPLRKIYGSNIYVIISSFSSESDEPLVLYSFSIYCLISFICYQVSSTIVFNICHHFHVYALYECNAVYMNLSQVGVLFFFGWRATSGMYTFLKYTYVCVFD